LANKLIHDIAITLSVVESWTYR